MSFFTQTATLMMKASIPLQMSVARAAPGLRDRGSRKRLIRHGVSALLPSAKIKHPESYAGQENVTVESVPGSERQWKRPLLSKRRAAVLRKEAIRTGTYGTFDPERGGVGWDPAWDVELAKANPHSLGRYTAMRVPKKDKRVRSREVRAQKIESAMVGMDERMEELQAAKHRNKAPVTIENTYKELMRVKK